MKKLYVTHLLMIVLFLSFTGRALHAQQTKDKPITLKHWMTPEEAKLKHLIGKDAKATEPPDSPVTNLAEFDQMQSVLIRYSFGISYQLIAAMSEECNVTTIVASTGEQTYVTNQYQNQGVNLDNCDFIIAPSNSYWTRDYGPWFIFDGNDEMGIVDFTYNRPRPYDNAIPSKVADELGINLFEMDIETAGGNYMTDGMGQSASSDLIWVENSGYTHDEIDEIFQNYLGIETYHVLDDPNNTYIDHIDCWGKFLDVDKVIIGQVPSTDPRYDDFEYVADYFANEISSYGNHYQVYRVQTPGQSQVTPYTNSLIVNDKVLVPQTGNQLDDDALEVYEEAMPGYEIVGIYYNQWYNTDAIHCRARGTVDQGLLYLKHFPLLGEIPYEDEYPISATITPFSGEPLYSDSVKLYYRTGNNPYSSITMTNVFGYQYKANIPAQEMGAEVSYYIFAADESGRREKHPFIGSADPHVFTIGPPENPDVTASPDSLIYLDVIQCDTGQIAWIYNNNPVPVSINYINKEGYDAGFQWMIDPWTIELPYELEAWDSIDLRVKIGIPVDYTFNLLTDTLFVGTDVDTHNVYICVDESLVSTREINTSSFRAYLYPNPVKDELNIHFSDLSDGVLLIQIMDLQGRIIAEHAESIHGKTEKILNFDRKIQSLQEGVYFVRILNGEEQETRKFVRLH